MYSSSKQIFTRISKLGITKGVVNIPTTQPPSSYSFRRTALGLPKILDSKGQTKTKTFNFLVLKFLSRDIDDDNVTLQLHSIAFWSSVSVFCHLV